MERSHTRLNRPSVHYMPKDLTRHLYVLEEFDIAMHLCACGCGFKLKTPLWTNGMVLYGDQERAYPSAFRRELAAALPVTLLDRPPPDVLANGGRNRSQPAGGMKRERCHAYYEGLYRQRGGLPRRFWRWLKGLSKR